MEKNKETLTRPDLDARDRHSALNSIDLDTTLPDGLEEFLNAYGEVFKKKEVYDILAFITRKL
jgi:hypothetical protein